MAAKTRRPATSEELDDIAERVHELADAVGTRTHAASVAGISPQHLHNMITGTCVPSIIVLSRLTKAAGYSLEWIATGEGPKRTTSEALYVEAMRAAGAQVRPELDRLRDELREANADRDGLADKVIEVEQELARVRRLLGNVLVERALAEVPRG